MLAVTILTIITIILLSKCSGPCLANAKKRSVLLCLKCHISGIFLPPKQPGAVLPVGLGCLHTAALLDSLRSEVSDNALCDSSPRPFPVCMRSEGDRQGQQNLPELETPPWIVGGTAGKSVMDQKQMTLNPWKYFPPRSLLIFSKCNLWHLQLALVHANVFIQC